MSTTTVKTNAGKIEKARKNTEDAKAKVIELKNTINEKILKNEDYSVEAEAIKDAAEEYEAMQLCEHLYCILYGEDDDRAPILKLVDEWRWECKVVKTESDKLTKKVTAYVIGKKVVNYDLLFFARKYGKENNNIAGLNDAKALDCLDELYYMLQANQAVRYTQTIQKPKYLKLHEEWVKDPSKPNPFSKTQISKAIIKAFEAFLGASPKLSTRVKFSDDKNNTKEFPLVNFLIDSVIEQKESKGEYKTHTVKRDKFASKFLQVMHCILNDKDIVFVYEEEKEEEDVYKDIIEIEDKTNEAEAK